MSAQAGLLRDQTVVVTGAGSGIGRATAVAAAAAGARVVAADIHADRLAELATELGGRMLLTRVVDVADREQMRAFADAVHAQVAAVDLLVNNAGVALGGTFLETSLDDWDWLLGINLKGVVHGCHFFAPRMVDRKRGHIVNIASILGIHATPNVTAYVASKFAVLGLSRSLRSELAVHNVGVTAVCPGMIATAIVADGRLSGARTEAARSRMVERFKRGTPPAAVAAVILDAARTNPAVRTVGRDAWFAHALTRLIPDAAHQLSGSLSRRMNLS